KERPTNLAKEPAVVGAISWNFNLDGAAVKSIFVEACEFAHALDGKGGKVAVQHLDSELVVGPKSVALAYFGGFTDFGKLEFPQEPLRWLMKKPVRTIRLTREGILGATVIGQAGEYLYYLCAIGWDFPL